MTLGPLTFTSQALWLAPPVIAALVLFRLFQTRRQNLQAASLLLWRRVAAQQPAARSKRLIFDFSLLLQILALLCVIAALAAPSLALGARNAREFVVVVDNGPATRARGSDGTLAWRNIADEAQRVISKLNENDSVLLVASAPFPRDMTEKPVSKSDAAKLLSQISPALSGPDAKRVWMVAADRMRSGERSAIVISAANAPQAMAQSNAQWICAAPAEKRGNVAVTHFGSAWISADSKNACEVLARVRNYSEKTAEGTMELFVWRGSEWKSAARKPLKVEASAESALTFPIEKADTPIRIVWKSTADALPEDDAITAIPRPLDEIAVRFHGTVPALEKLYRRALNAKILAETDSGAADLEIYSGSVPDRVPDGARAIMLIAPRMGYRTIFDVGANVIEHPQIQRDADDPLLRGIATENAGSFAISKAVEILGTGDFKVLLRDTRTQRALIARFNDERARKGFLLAFIPGQGADDRPLHESLFAILTRMAIEASGAGDPYVTTPIAQKELQTGTPIPSNWSADLADNSGWGVLDERASALERGTPSSRANANSAASSARTEGVPLAPWLIALALLFLFFERKYG